MFRLKRYQTEALEVLKKYLEKARLTNAREAYSDIKRSKHDIEDFKQFQPLKGLEDSPYVCLRLPTGGGKTLLSAYSIKLAGEAYIENEYPITLWLVPTNIIKAQTLEALKNPDNANYKTLEKAFNGRFRVFDISDFKQIRPQDITDNICIVVSTFAALRVDKTEGRKVYSHDESLESHFSITPSNTPNMEKSEVSNQIKFSFANLLNFHRPLVIVDEAHNAKSELSIHVLNRIGAACVIEYTATPAKNSNVLYSVSAAELKAEEMIKLPIILSEHHSPQDAITAAIQTRQKLEDIARRDKDYIRPIVLFQAENKNGEMNATFLKQYLLENEGVKQEQIVIATGEQKELDNINLFDPNCEIRYVITVQALKEGWDCSFAYILCSVAKVESKTAIEQLLGRVLRMPYAKSRSASELNKAYAHVSSSTWSHTVTGLRDSLVQMGFNTQDANEFIHPQLNLFGGHNQDSNDVPLEFNVTSKPDLSKLDTTEQTQVTVTSHTQGMFNVKIDNPTEQIVKKLSKTVSNSKDKEEILLKGKIYIKNKFNNLPPATRGEEFSVPQLCFAFEDGEDELAEREVCLERSGWDLLEYYTPLNKEAFSFDETAKQYLADIKGKQVVVDQLYQSNQMNFRGVETEMTQQDLCLWLDRRLRQIDVKQEVLLEYLRLTIRDLLSRDDIDQAKLVRAKYILAKVLQDKIDAAREKAYAKEYQQCFFGQDALISINKERFSFKFDPNNYPASSYYDGNIVFSKHYYSNIGKMNTEEAKCAEVIDKHPLVKFWVRNLERLSHYAFWLPTARGQFYPDFVVKLHDNRLMVVEYKGGQFKGSDDATSKELIGKAWANKSKNIFLMCWEKDNKGLNMYEQINNCLTQSTEFV